MCKTEIAILLGNVCKICNSNLIGQKFMQPGHMGIETLVEQRHRDSSLSQVLGDDELVKAPPTFR